MMDGIIRWFRYVIALAIALVMSLTTSPALPATAALLFVVPVALAADDKTIYVDDSAGSGGDGEDWTSAYRILQDAIDEAFS